MTAPEPKRRNPAKTRARILDAAFELFSSAGYAKTGIRDIAQRADVASSLILKYFGTKAALFQDALVNAIYVRGFFPRDKADFGLRMTRMVLSRKDAQIPAMMVLAIADPESRDIARKITRRVVLESMADWLGPPNAFPRALEMLILLNGFAIQTGHLLDEPVPEETIAWFARALQEIVDRGEGPDQAHLLPPAG